MTDYARGYREKHGLDVAVELPSFMGGASALDGEHREPNGQRDRFAAHAYTSSEVCNLPPLEPLVDGVLFIPGESVIYSPPKLAKTFFALDLGLSVASDQPFMGREVRQGPVVFIVAEGVGGLSARVQAWHDYHGRAGAYVDDITFVTMAVNLMDPTAVRSLCTFLKTRGAVLTVIDTLHRCAAGADENSAKDMGRIVEALDQIRDATAGHVSTIHHAGKDVSKGMRGSSALLGAVDTVIELSGDANAIRVAVTDQKDTETVAPWWCHLEPVGAGAVIEQVATTEMLTDTQRKTIKALRNLPTEDRTSTKWEEMAAAEGVSRRAFFMAKKALLDSREVVGGGGRGALYRLADESGTP